jgi:putative transposase
MTELTVGLMEYFAFYNADRPHQALGYMTPTAAYDSGTGGGAIILDKYGKATESAISVEQTQYGENKVTTEPCRSAVSKAECVT